MQNFIDLSQDKLFWTATRNTFFYSFGAVTLGTIGALSVALLLNQHLPGTTFLRVIYYMPSIASGVAVSILWMWLFNPQVGLVNYLLSLIGIKGPLWLASPQWALPALIIKSLWAHWGQHDHPRWPGCRRSQHRCTRRPRSTAPSSGTSSGLSRCPMLSPVLFYVLVITTIASFQILTDVLVMTQGGPGTATFVYVYYIYQAAFQYLKMGYASALAWILFTIILGLTLLQLWGSKKWVYYEDEGAR